jgi:hypothetical protein
MIAAVYARKSTEQNGVGDEEKSVTRQIDHAKAYAAKKGWMASSANSTSDEGAAVPGRGRRSAGSRSTCAGTLRVPSGWRPEKRTEIRCRDDEGSR